jgi:RNA-directed DNA polymerase
MKSRLPPSAATTGTASVPLPAVFETNVRGLPERVFILRQKLYGKAKAAPRFRFYALYDRIYRGDVLAAAWALVARNDGAPGVDGISVDDIASQPNGITTFLEELHESLRTKAYRPQAVRRTMIPKANGGQRPLGIPTVRDRVVQQAALLILEPIFEADFQESSYGFRPGRSAHDAMGALRSHIRSGRQAIIDADLQSYFDTIPHDRLLACLAKRISDRSVLRLIRLWLRTPVEEPGDNPHGPRRRRRPTSGTPQGGVISPLLANCYLHWLDKLFYATDGPGVWANARIVRYADDFVILARYISQEITDWLVDLLENRMGLKINWDKTRMVHVNPDGLHGLDFLGFTLRYVRGQRHSGNGRYLSQRPSRQSVLRLHDRVRDMTCCRWNFTAPQAMVSYLNQYLCGWRAYFGHGHRGKIFSKIDGFVSERCMRHLLRRSQRSPHLPAGWSWYRFLTERYGLVTISGSLPTAKP